MEKKGSGAADVMGVKWAMSMPRLSRIQDLDIQSEYASI